MLTWNEKRQLTKLAAWYYIDGWTHEQIAAKLGVSRPVVSKQLQKAREIGIIDFYIESETETTLSLENKLKKKFELTYIKVIPNNTNLSSLNAHIMKAAVQYLTTRLPHIASLGIGWGNTMFDLVAEFPYRPFASLHIVPLIGGISASTKKIHSNDLVTQLAKKLMCSYSYLYSPFLATTLEMKEQLLQIPEIAQTLSEARQVDLAVVGIGVASKSATLSKVGYLSEEDVLALEKSNVAGDITSCFFDKTGNEISCSFNLRTIGIGLKELRAIPEVVGIAYEKEKVASAYISLKHKYLNSFITNEDTALSLLNMP